MAAVCLQTASMSTKSLIRFSSSKNVQSCLAEHRLNNRKNQIDSSEAYQAAVGAFFIASF